MRKTKCSLERLEAVKTLETVTSTFMRQRLVLEMILALKQICNHPAFSGPR